MKTIFTFLLIMVFSLGSMANDSKLRIKLGKEQYFRVYLDGKPYSVYEKFKKNNLFPGRHTVKIYKRHNKHLDLVYNGFVDIPAHAKVKTKLKNQVLEIKDIEYFQDQHNDHFDFVNYNDNNQGGCSQTCSPNGNGNTGNGGNFYFTGNNNYYSGMHPSAFDQLIKLMKEESFGHHQIDLLKQAIQGRGISSSQLKTALEVYDFDSERLKAAKMAHQYTVDKHNFWMVGEAFEYSSNRKKLFDYLNNL